MELFTGQAIAVGVEVGALPQALEGCPRFFALTGFVGTSHLAGIYLGFTALIIIQFFFGVGEAGAFPNIAKALYNWFPAADRGFANRWTFYIGKDGRIAYIDKTVKPATSAEDMIAKMSELKAPSKTE